MVEQICEKCATRYSMYAPQCPSCGNPSAMPAKKPGCPQAPAAPAPKPKPAPAPAPAPASKAANVEKKGSPITVEAGIKCPFCEVSIKPKALAGIAVALFVISRLLRK